MVGYDEFFNLADNEYLFHAEGGYIRDLFPSGVGTPID